MKKCSKSFIRLPFSKSKQINPLKMFVIFLKQHCQQFISRRAFSFVHHCHIDKICNLFAFEAIKKRLEHEGIGNEPNTPAIIFPNLNLIENHLHIEFDCGDGQIELQKIQYISFLLNYLLTVITPMLQRWRVNFIVLQGYEHTCLCQ